MAKPRLLITRFAPDAQRLADSLIEHGIYSIAQPLLKTEAVVNNVDPFTRDYDFIIAVSRNAVKYTQHFLQGRDWPISCYLAVGSATQKLLKTNTKQSVEVPFQDFNSEGLLALPLLQRLDNCSILILRGVGGREFLKEQLTARGACVDYYEPYQRVAIKLPRSMTADKWQQQGINGAIISSIELLERLIVVTEEIDQGWLRSLTLFAASERILKYAQQLGFHKTALLPSITNQKIIDYFINEGSYD